MPGTIDDAGQRGRPRPLPVLVLVVASILVSFGLAETVLRAVGRGPVRPRAEAPDVPVMHEPDPELGWRNRPGTYVFGAKPTIRMTFWPDGTRATAEHPVQAGPLVDVIGDSFAQGWAVSDEETFPWRMQARFPRLRVRNHASAGYGTTQALVALRASVREPDGRPALVVYGFSDFHEGRNVATPAWLRDLVHYAGVPWASLDGDGALRLHPPDRYRPWPLRERSAVMATLEAAWADATRPGRVESARAVTDALLVELDRTAREAGARLLVVELSQWLPGTHAHYKRVLDLHRIALIDCKHPDFMSPAMQVPVYGHPNATMNAHWADCIERAIVADPSLGLPVDG